MPLARKELVMNFEASDQSAIRDFWPKTAINWLELIVKFLLIAGSIGGVYEYFDVKQENRVKKTMEFFDKFNSDELLNAQLNLTKTWDLYYEDIKKLRSETVANEDERVLILKGFVLPIIKHHKQEPDINLILSFLENVEICVKNAICDDHVSQVFFGKYAMEFYELYNPWFAKRSEIYPGYACLLKRFVQKINTQNTVGIFHDAQKNSNRGLRAIRTTDNFYIPHC